MDKISRRNIQRQFNSRKLLCLFLISVLIIGSITMLIQYSHYTGNTPYDSPVPSKIAYSLHDPISIVTNSGFTNASGVVWGSGTEGDPYIIEGWEIWDGGFTGIEILAASAHVTIRNIYIHGFGPPITGRAIWLDETSNVTIENSVFDDCTKGMEIFYCNNITIRESTFSNCFDSCIHTTDSTYIQFILSSFSSSDTGLDIGWSTDINVSYSDFSGNRLPIDLADASEIDVYANNITSNTRAIDVTETSGLRVSHNNFINNTWKPTDNGLANYWNESYPSGGNFWSSYLGNDNFSGPLQNLTGGDGIGDTPYVINSNVRDYYPLLTMFNVPNSPPIASFSVLPFNGDTLTQFQFDASNSSDGQTLKAGLSLRWDWDADGTWDTNWTTNKSAFHQFASPGNYTSRLQVRDGGGLIDEAELTIQVDEMIPEPSILILITMMIVIFSLFRRRNEKV